MCGQETKSPLTTTSFYLGKRSAPMRAGMVYVHVIANRPISRVPGYSKKGSFLSLRCDKRGGATGSIQITAIECFENGPRKNTEGYIREAVMEGGLLVHLFLSSFLLFRSWSRVLFRPFPPAADATDRSIIFLLPSIPFSRPPLTL